MAEQHPQVDGPIEEGTVLWEPTAERIARSALTGFSTWLEDRRGLVFAGYPDIWSWSVSRLEEFWSSVSEYFEVRSPGAAGEVLVRGNGAEHARWFPGDTLNYVDRLLRHPPESLAVIACAEDEALAPEYLTYGDLLERVGAAARGLRRLGVTPGDRVAAVLPNGVPAVVAFLATASLGAIWSSCAPEFGAPSMVDRFRQIDPKVLVVSTGYRYNGRDHDLQDKIASLVSELPGLDAVVAVPAGTGPRGPDVLSVDNPSGREPILLGWAELLSEPEAVAPLPVDFSHPLWILYSSGTTGLPKPIVHGHGGILLEHLKALSFHSDLRRGDRFFWFTTTGWMMWNFLVGGLLLGTTIVCYDGDPTWPDEGRLWRMARDVGVTYFGTSAPYIEACRRSGVSPRGLGDLHIHTVGSTGAPLSPEGFLWGTREVGDDVLVGSVSGGTDVCTGFLVSCPWLEVRAGELQCRALGADVEAFDEDGRSVVGEVGELVVTEPMPSMPVALWGDDGTRLHDSYFAHFSDTWRHGDWVKMTPGGGAVVYGRSDATLNRGGVRMGTAEFYRVIESLPEVADALVVDTSELGREGELVLFVVPVGQPGEDELTRSIRSAIRDRLSPRHVPDRIIRVRSLPRTINGKKLEVPIRRILLGVDPGEAVATGALGDPSSLDELLETIGSEGLR